MTELLTGMVKSAANIAMLAASAQAKRKEATMSEGMEIGDQKELMKVESEPDMVVDAQEAFFSLEDFITGAMEYLKSLLPSQQ